jgi:hypothetical protein
MLRYFSKYHADVLDQVPKSFALTAIICLSLQLIGVSLIAEYTDPKDREGNADERAKLLVNDEQETIESQVTENPEEEMNSLGIK